MEGVVRTPSAFSMTRTFLPCKVTTCVCSGRGGGEGEAGEYARGVADTHGQLC